MSEGMGLNLHPLLSFVYFVLIMYIAAFEGTPNVALNHY